MSKSKNLEKRTLGRPGPLQPVEVDAAPVTEEEVVHAIKEFIGRFVSWDRRSRALQLLIPPKKRREHLRNAFVWMNPALCEELDGASGFPQGLADTFGNARGILITGQAASRMTVPEAASLHDDSIFISDDRKFAVLFYEIGSPTLCSIPR